MKWPLELKTGLNVASAIILLAGLGGAAWIYQHAGPDSYGALGYEDDNGALYPLLPEDSKQYLRGLELYGGTANVLADELRRWLGGFFQGKSLAFILGGAAIIISFGFFYAAEHLPNRRQSQANRDKNRTGPA